MAKVSVGTFNGQFCKIMTLKFQSERSRAGARLREADCGAFVDDWVAKRFSEVEDWKSALAA